MGITGLLPALKSISTQRHLSEFAGQTLGVDAYVWLHRGVFTCATELATGKDTTKYVDYAMHRVRLLRHHGIEPYMVFDGGPLPAKKGTEGDRQARRAEHLALGNALAAQGNTTQAREHYVKCIDVTPQMAKQLIKALKAENVQYVVAPYEADAELTYLEQEGIISGIITEDSDLLVFGCRNVLYKMDAVSATAECISQADFPRITSAVDGISLHGFSLAQFRAMAILSGCDYLPSIPGIGLKTACSLLRKWRTAEQVIRSIRMEGKKTVPRGYLDNFRLAEKCFLHQRVYDPVTERLVHLTEPEEVLDEAANAYVGPAGETHRGGGCGPNNAETHGGHLPEL
ncbi:PIN domain-like protein [Mycena amicta]|nr:PIN domain-like protein [Mycena amicta]